MGKEEYFRKLFYQKWGTYENYLRAKEKLKEKERKLRLVSNISYLKAKSENELLVKYKSGKEKIFKGKITLAEIELAENEENKQKSFI